VVDVRRQAQLRLLLGSPLKGSLDEPRFVTLDAVEYDSTWFKVVHQWNKEGDVFYGLQRER
jgi:hypothetical protein